MKIRLVFGFGALIFLAMVQPGSVQGGRLEREAAQATPITTTVLAVVRNQGATLYDRPNGEVVQTLVGGSLIRARLRSTDLLWVLVETRDETEGWVEVRTLLAAGLGRLPIEEPTPTTTSTPAPTLSPTATLTPSPTVEATVADVMAVTVTATTEAMAGGQMAGTPEASTTPDSMAVSTPQPTEEAMPESTAEAMPVATSEAMPEATPTPFEPPDGPTALTLTRIGGAVLWDGEDGAFVAHYRAGSRLTAAFRTEDNEWFYVYHDEGVHGWASADELLVVTGHLLTVKEFVIPQEGIVAVEVTETPTATPVATPDATTTPEAAAMPEATATPEAITTPDVTATPAPTPQKVIVTVNSFGQRLNVRAGPGTEYDIVAKAVGGVTFNGIGRTESGDWVQVAIADLPSGYGWVSAAFVTTEGPFDELPVGGEMEEMDQEDS